MLREGETGVTPQTTLSYDTPSRISLLLWVLRLVRNCSLGENAHIMQYKCEFRSILCSLLPKEKIMYYNYNVREGC
ncbi:hypothetical protein TNIN_149001 [Trichonephila inaurata madagascariensis]|uniref:Uncharacterized protein n=1 Tax=Trichonephila inaurata madagascariensis TaxID=2747483 RepID=A0A8X7CAN9_9ARAC|nr:hypothetical protein TNIN_149001 [Trichonephila inaurata madagascariensis]